MKASETNILKFIGGLDKVFIIPPFQRNYEWSFEQCDELFEDIINSYNSKKHITLVILFTMKEKITGLRLVSLY